MTINPAPERLKKITGGNPNVIVYYYHENDPLSEKLLKDITRFSESHFFHDVIFVSVEASKLPKKDLPDPCPEIPYLASYNKGRLIECRGAKNKEDLQYIIRNMLMQNL